MRALVTFLSLSLSLGAAAPALAQTGPCLLRPDEARGTVVLEASPEHGPIEIWRFGERLGVTPVELSLPSGCVQVEARVASQGLRQVLRLDVEPSVKKTLRLKISGPNSHRERAEALLRAAEWGDTSAREKVLTMLTASLSKEVAAPVAPSAVPAPSCAIAAGSAPGFLTLETTPPAVIFLGQMKLGETPLSKVRVPSGCHELDAVSEDGRRRKVSVVVEPNATQAYKFSLDAPQKR